MDGIQTFKTPSGDEMVILTKAEYHTLVARKKTSRHNEDEDDEGIAEARRIMARIKDGTEPTIPFDVVKMHVIDNIPTIRAWRMYKKLSLATLAKKIGKSQPYLTQIENGTRKGTLQTMAKLAKALGTSVDCLID